MLRKILSRVTSQQLIMLSFALLILAGALLLNLPIASQNGRSIGFLNALFTSTSATCVTGLIVVNTLSHWTTFGKIVILTLIQVGGLGFLTFFMTGMVLLRQRISLKNRMIIQASFNQNNVGGMVRLVKKVIIVTFVLEAIGALILTIAFYFSSSISVKDAFSYGIFHSISAFCNAGFDIIGADNLTPYGNVLSVCFPVMILIITGGLGFGVLIELYRCFTKRKNKSLFRLFGHLSLHSKITLTVTAALIISGTLFFLLLEWNNPATLGSLPFFEKVNLALFQSVTLRTAGFNTINQASLTEPSLFISCLYMLIGGSSGGTAGGIKTVTFGIIMITMLSALKGRNKAEAFERTLPMDLLQKALTVTCTMFIVVVTSTLILCFTEQSNIFSHSFLDLLFECSSAAGTVGISTGITPYLSDTGKIVIIICMFLGRLSPITVVAALNLRLHASEKNTSYIDERVIIG